MTGTTRELALQAHHYNVAAMGDLSRLQGTLKTALDLAEAAILNCGGANHAVDSILVATAPPGTPSGSDTDYPRVGLILLVVGLLCSGVSAANYSREDVPMAAKKVKVEPGPILTDARAAQLAREWCKACNLYGDAYRAGASAELTLGRQAECEFYDGRMTDAAATLNMLESVTKGGSPTVPYLRGLIAAENKDVAEARKQFKLSEMAGERRATLMLKRLH